MYPNFFTCWDGGSHCRKDNQYILREPLALSMEEADRMVEAVRRNKVKAMVGHVLRFFPEYSREGDIIKNGTLGKPLYAQCERLCGIDSEEKNSWKVDKDLSEGTALDMQIHDIDYLIWLFGLPESIESAGVYDGRLGGWAFVNTSIRFENDIKGFVNAEWNVAESYPFKMVLRIIFEEGILEWIYKSAEGYAGSRKQKFPLLFNNYYIDLMVLSICLFL